MFYISRALLKALKIVKNQKTTEPEEGMIMKNSPFPGPLKDQNDPGEEIVDGRSRGL